MSRVGILVASLAVIMLASTGGPACAAQMEFRTWVEPGATEAVEIKVERTGMINYDQGGVFAGELRGPHCTKRFTVHATDPV